MPSIKIVKKEAERKSIKSISRVNDEKDGKNKQ